MSEIISTVINLEILNDSQKVQDIKRSITIILGTRAGTLAMDRDFGLSWDFLDLPTEIAKASISQEVMLKLARYEPRAKVERITFSGVGSEGKLIPKVEVTINE